MEQRQGTYINNLKGKLSYKSFRPSQLPPTPNIEISTKILNTLSHASHVLGVLNGMSYKIPNINLFVSMYVKKEAVLSSQIEGTQCTLEDIFNSNINQNINRNIEEVVSYVKASEYATNKLKTMPLCLRLLRQTHKILMQNTRGKEKDPGVFRKSQNWIGGPGSTINNARFVPPNVEDMNNALYELEQFINNDCGNPLINAALIHYQFETIHPFLDGNGRIGRLLIILYLLEKNMLDSPVLYISYYLKAHRIEYYDRITNVREEGNYEQWVLFFLEAIANTAADAIESINKMEQLHNKNEAVIQKKQTVAELIYLSCLIILSSILLLTLSKRLCI